MSTKRTRPPRPVAKQPPVLAEEPAQEEPLQSEQGEVEPEGLSVSELAGVVPEPEAAAEAEDSKPAEAEEAQPAPEALPAVPIMPTGFSPADAAVEAATEVADLTPAPAPRATSEHVILDGPASYGPVIIDGKATRCLKGKPYRIADPAERMAVLGTGRFRLATPKDMVPAPSAGRGGPITRGSFPPGAMKGGLIKP